MNANTTTARQSLRDLQAQADYADRVRHEDAIEAALNDLIEIEIAAAKAVDAPAEETLWVPVDGGEEVELTEAQIKAIARRYNNYATIRRGGSQRDGMRLRTQLVKEFADLELSVKDMARVADYYTDNLYDTRNALTWI